MTIQFGDTNVWLHTIQVPSSYAWTDCSDEMKTEMFLNRNDFNEYMLKDEYLNKTSDIKYAVFIVLDLIAGLYILYDQVSMLVFLEVRPVCIFLSLVATVILSAGLGIGLSDTQANCIADICSGGGSCSK